MGAANGSCRNPCQIADGRITLYQRDDVRDGIWQCSLPAKGVRGYITRSTGLTDLDEAKEQRCRSWRN